MNPRSTKTGVGLAGAALVLSLAGGVAVAAGADDWYTGDNATVADPDKTAVALTLYDASGGTVTSGSTTTPLAAFVGAAGSVRAGDEFATLYVHLPQSDTAPGAWPGVQVTGTDRYAGAGSVTAPAGVSGKPYVRTTAAGYSLSDVGAALPTSGGALAGIYELRLRTSSATVGISDQYATAYVKVTGSTWTLTDAPPLGGESAVATTVTATWPATLGYGAAAVVKTTVAPASGSTTPSGTVRLVSGTTTLATATLSAAGTATLTTSRTALLPGSRTLKVVYAGASGTFTGSESAARTLKVAKAKPGKATLKVTRKPTSKKSGAATVTVPTASGLSKATGKVKITLKKGKRSKSVTVTLSAGKAKVALPKVPRGTWSVTVTYGGDVRYTATSTKVSSVKVTK